jgi:Protein of unknown function (DUF2442)
MPNSRKKPSSLKKRPPALKIPLGVDAVWLTRTTLTFDLSDGRSISVPLSFYAPLLAAPAETRQEYEIHGGSVYWSVLRLKLRAEDLLSGRKKL